jgi:hypothetical protein
MGLCVTLTLIRLWAAKLKRPWRKETEVQTYAMSVATFGCPAAERKRQT